MNKTLLIAKQEWKYLIHAPLAWTVLGVVTIITSFIFLSQIENFQLIAHELLNNPKSLGVTGRIVTPLYQVSSIILMMIIPVLAMNSFQRERWDGKMALLSAAPLSFKQIVMGKFFGLSLFLALVVFLITLMPLSLVLGAPIDLITLFINAFGLWLLLISFSAITLYLACVSKEPVITLSLSIGVLLILWLIDVNSLNTMGENSFARYISVLQHFENMLKSRINTMDLIYFVSLIGLFLSLSVRHLNREKERV